MADSSSFASFLGVGAPTKEMNVTKPQSPRAGQSAPDKSFKTSMEEAQKAKPSRPERPAPEKESASASASASAPEPTAQRSAKADDSDPVSTDVQAPEGEPQAELLAAPQPVEPTTPAGETLFNLFAPVMEPGVAADPDVTQTPAAVLKAEVDLTGAPLDAITGTLQGAVGITPSAATETAAAVTAPGATTQQPVTGSSLPGRQNSAATVPVSASDLSLEQTGSFELAETPKPLASDKPSLSPQSLAWRGSQTFDTGAITVEGLEPADGMAFESLAGDLLALQETSASEPTHGTTPLSRGGLLTEGFAPTGRINVPVNTPFGSPDWQGAVAERAILLVRQNIQSAELQLDPPELGPLQVRIQIQNDHAVVNFSSANVQVREALDQTMARLKDMLQEQGFSQVETGVSDHSDRRSRQQDGDAGRSVGPTADLAVDEAPLTQSLQVPLRSGIDYFA